MCCSLMSCHISVSLTAISVLLGIALVVLNNKYNTNNSNNRDNRLNIFIAILSSRHNHNKRHSLRNSWIQYVNNVTANRDLGLAAIDIDIRYKFIIGDNDCHIPPHYRYHTYSCDFREVTHTKQNQSEIFLNDYERSLTNSFNYLYRGFSFAVHEPIIITKLGIHTKFLVCGQNVSLVLLNAQNKEIVLQLNVSTNSTSINEIHYENTKKVLLPKNFYGLLLIDNNERFNFDVNISLNYNLNENGLLKVLRVYYGFSDYESLKYNQNLLIGPTFAYTVSDWDQLESYAEQQNKSFMLWKEETALINEKLLEEINEFDDIILVDLVDVYRNLPLKLLKAIQYSFTDHKLTHFLKTDDDCYLNIKNILIEMYALMNIEKLWFGKFRRLWPLEYYGKWAENDYGSPLYPPFACGSGYVLSFDIVKWLNDNINKLHIFQGEDVSLGIWLSAINPHYKNDIRWLCNTTEYKFQKSFSIPQLNPENIIEMHKILEK